MLSRIYTDTCHLFPKFRKFTRRHMYQFMARLYKKKDWSFMNYGYMPLHHDEHEPELNTPDEINRYSIQLYHHLASSVDLVERNVLEIGSGRGGGANYIKGYFSPRHMVGVDFSKQAVSLCSQHYQEKGLSFVPGDAEALPFNDDTFDAIVNVESSHCYESMTTFLNQVKRVLKPGGHFLFADFRTKSRLIEMTSLLENTGFDLLRFKDISQNVLRALDADENYRNTLIKNGAPSILKKLLREFSGVKGTTFYKRLLEGDVVYQSYVLQKPIVI